MHHEGGDHVIIVGEVERYNTNKGEPLTFSADSSVNFPGLSRELRALSFSRKTYQTTEPALSLGPLRWV